MGQVNAGESRRGLAPFNGVVEIGLRSLCAMTSAFPAPCSLQRLVVFDYLLVHSDDIPGGPMGLHPQTPHRGGEILVRRGVLQDALLLYQSRGLVERIYADAGLFFVATERSASFLDALGTTYVSDLRERADWVITIFGQLEDAELEAMIRARIGEWGAEFVMEAVLWSEGS